jgi:hypothetical protein
MMSVRQTWIALIYIVLLGTGASAESPDETLNRASRAVARIMTVENVCSSEFVIDHKLLSQAKQVLISESLQRFDEPLLRRRIRDVTPEIVSDIKREGVTGWCFEQRERYRVPGYPEFFGSPLR